MYSLTFTPRAIQMQREAYEWYESKQTNLGVSFLKELEHCYGKLQLHPDLYSKVGPIFAI
jgi:hypothetical protein